MKLNPNKTGLVLGAFLGLLHLCWVALVALSVAQPLLDFVFRIHMIDPVYVVSAFDAGTAATLVAFTALIGYVVGVVFAWVWNKLHP